MINYILYIIGVSSLSLFIWKTFESGMIFRKVYLFFIFLWIKNWRKKDRWKRILIKPFICIYCYSTWLSIFTFLYYFGPKIEILFFIGINYLLISFFKKYLNI